MIILPKLNFGNLNTIKSFLDQIGITHNTIEVKEIINLHEGKVLIPGNGNWKSYIDSGLVELIKKNKNLKFIGICGGLQIFFDSSEENPGKGASILEGKVIKLSSITPTIDYLPVSNYGHMYFSNSYGIPFKKFDNALVESYKIDNKNYIACIQYKNYVGFQFHPEVSGPSGIKVFKEFTAKLNC